MGYFKRRREQRTEEIKRAIVQSAKVSNTLFKQEIGHALNKVNTQRYEYEDNMRVNLSMALESSEVCDDIIDEVAGVIESGMELFEFKLSKDKRKQLAKQILFELAVKK